MTTPSTGRQARPTTVIADPQRCLASADNLLRGDAAVTGGWWPRACACLIRLALESGMDRFLLRTSPPTAACGSRRAKLLVLRRYRDRDLCRRATFAWATLSRATHHHCYDLAPAAVELRHLHAEVTAILQEM